MLTSQVTLDQDFVIGRVDQRLFGGFAEHLGRHIYTGIYEPGHPLADKQGFRTDVLDLVRKLRLPVMRYPGGNFVSGYDWLDGVGPREQRPRRLDLAWHSIETNHFGTNEFMDWCRLCGSSPMLAVNLGTAGPNEARNLVEYCNHPGGTHWSDLRRRHGYEQPHCVKTWCLGNEMDGSWQIGHKSGAEYGRLACEAAKLMKWVDPAIELVACGSSSRGMTTFGSWELDVLAQAIDQVDYLSLHTYCSKHGHDTPSFLAQSESMGDFIREAAALCDVAAVRAKTSKRVMLAFDEWNVWYHTDAQQAQRLPWQEAPTLLEDVYTMEDALVAGSMLITLLNHADRVKIACLAQIVNVIGPIMTVPGGPAWAQTIFYPFMQASRLGRGTVLQAVIDAPAYDTPERQQVPYLTAAFVRHDEPAGLVAFAVNRSLDTPLRLEVALRGFALSRVRSWTVLRHDDLQAVNAPAAQTAVAPVKASGATVADGRLTAVLPPASWNVLELA